MNVKSPVRPADAFMKNILISAAALGVVFLLMEFFLRLAGFHPVNMQFQPVLYSKELGWVLKKNYNALWEELEWKVPYRTNARGFRDREHTLEKTPGRKRILILGDSFAEGYGVREEARWASRLENNMAGDAEVVNLGVRGYDILQEYRLLLQEGLAWQPEWVIQMVNESDYLATPLSSDMDTTRRFRPPYRIEGEKLVLLEGRAEPGYSVLNPAWGALKALLYRSAALVWLRHRLEHSMQGSSLFQQAGQWAGFRQIHRAEMAVSEYEKKYPDAVDRVYQHLAELGRQKGFRSLIVWVGEHPAPEGLKKSVLEHQAGQWLEIVLPASLRFQYDPHPTPEGNRWISEKIFEELTSLGIF